MGIKCSSSSVEYGRIIYAVLLKNANDFALNSVFNVTLKPQANDIFHYSYILLKCLMEKQQEQKNFYASKYITV